MGARPDAREEEGCGRLVRQHDGPFPARGHAGVPSRGAETPGERREVSVPGRRASEAGYQNGVDHCLSLCATLPRYPFETAEDTTNRKVTCWNEDEVVVRTVAATMARRRPHCGTRPNSALAVGRAPWAVAGAIPCAVKPGRRPSVRQSLDPTALVRRCVILSPAARVCRWCRCHGARSPARLGRGAVPRSACRTAARRSGWRCCPQIRTDVVARCPPYCAWIGLKRNFKVRHEESDEIPRFIPYFGDNYSAIESEARPNASWSLQASALNAVGSCLLTLSQR